MLLTLKMMCCGRELDGRAAVASAPGRLDVMGGVSDYSGGTVLQLPVAARTTVAACLTNDAILGIQSRLEDGTELSFRANLRDWLADPVAICAKACTLEDTKWAGYIAGCVALLIERGLWTCSAGVCIVLESDVPLGAGVSSSASVEVATLAALSALNSSGLADMDLALAAQEVEHRVVGAKCGIMDQATVALGQENRLLVLKCQPHAVLGHQPVPSGWRFVGIDSRVRHSVGGSAYGAARNAAELGLQLAKKQVDTRLEHLANLPDSAMQSLRFESSAEHQLVRNAVRFAVHEHARCREFLALTSLAGETAEEDLMREAGQLMLQTHDGYSELGLGCAETELILNLLMTEGPENGVFGARVSGGGSGGTVVALCDEVHSPEALVRTLATYGRTTGLDPRLIDGSSGGVEVRIFEQEAVSAV